jgi:hypothetical protein
MRTLSWRLPDMVGGYPLPTGAQFSPQKPTLDPDIFTPTEQMRPEVRDWCLAKVNDFWQPRYGSWWEWAKVYLAGSTASYWWSGDNDFDLLVGVSNHLMAQSARHAQGPGYLVEGPTRLLGLSTLSQPELCDHFNAEFREGFNVEAVEVPGHDEPYGLTLYANPYSYDIRAIKPYAAYSISDDHWAVHPAKLPRGFSAKSMPRSFWESVGKMAEHIRDVLAEADPERTEHATDLLEQLHHGRQLAYSGTGSGVFDQRQILWLTLERLGVLQDLISAVHPDSTPHPRPLVP